MDLDDKNNKPTGGVTLHNIERARFLPPTKIVSWITIRSRFELDRHYRINHHKFIGGFGSPVVILIIWQFRNHPLALASGSEIFGSMIICGICFWDALQRGPKIFSFLHDYPWVTGIIIHWDSIAYNY